MKVLFLSSWYPSNENHGFGVFVKEHAKAIHTTSTEITVLAVLVFRSDYLFKIDTRDFEDENGIRTVEIIIHSRFRDIIYHLTSLQKNIAYSYIKKHILADFTPDIVHSNVIFPAGIIGDFIAGKINKPHIITEHWSKISGLLNKPYLSALAKKTYQNAQVILPVSDFLKSTILNLLPVLSPSKFHTVPNVIDNETFTYSAKKTNSDNLQFCAIATWATKRSPDKMPELFMEALNILQRKTGKKIKLVMVGGGNRVDELTELASKKTYPIDFLGFQPKCMLAKVLQNSDYFVHASSVETFGVVIAEALMTGTPVICSNVGALPELVDSSNGVLCENTVENWVSGIETAINTKFDNKKIAESVKEKFSYEAIGQRIESIYKNM